MKEPAQFLPDGPEIRPASSATTRSIEFRRSRSAAFSARRTAASFFMALICVSFSLHRSRKASTGSANAQDVERLGVLVERAEPLLRMEDW